MSGPSPYAGPVKVLVIGTGAREHAIVKALGADPDVDAVIVAPGNPGMDAIALCEALPGGVLDGAGIAALAMRKLQALHLLATPGVRTSTDVIVDRGMCESIAKSVPSDAPAPARSTRRTADRRSQDCRG